MDGLSLRLGISISKEELAEIWSSLSVTGLPQLDFEVDGRNVLVRNPVVRNLSRLSIESDLAIAIHRMYPGCAVERPGDHPQATGGMQRG